MHPAPEQIACGKLAHAPHKQTRSMDTRGHYAPEPSAVIDMKDLWSPTMRWVEETETTEICNSLQFAGVRLSNRHRQLRCARESYRGWSPSVHQRGSSTLRRHRRLIDLSANSVYSTLATSGLLTRIVSARRQVPTNPQGQSALSSPPCCSMSIGKSRMTRRA